MYNGKKSFTFFLAFGVLLLAIVVLPLFMTYLMATEIWIFALAAVSFNLLLGYTGFLSFGHAIFFGMGAYAAGLIRLHYNIPLIPTLIIGAATAGVVALLIGFFSLKRREIYFVFLTFAFNLMVYHVAYVWVSLTGGEDGLIGVERPDNIIGGWKILDLDSAKTFYYFTAIVFLICFVMLNHLIQTPFGKILVGIRENEKRMGAIGYNTKGYLLACFVISGIFTGIAGVLYALLFRQVPLDILSWMTSGNVVFMAIVGGIGNFYGPIIGAAFFIWLSESISVIWARWPLLFGVAFIIVIMTVKGGFLEALSRLMQVLKKKRV